MIAETRHHGILLHDCSLPGETHADGRYIGHANGIQVSRRRFLLVCGTRGWRGTDDNASIIYQLRDGAYDGPIVKEGFFVRTIIDWDAMEDGQLYVKSHVHPIAFGVPKGALVDGRPACNENVFAVSWLRLARYVDPETGLMLNVKETNARLQASTEVVEWVQFRLNDAEDDIEIIQPARILRQKGFGTGYAFCDAEVRFMRQTMASPTLYNVECTEWILYGDFESRHIAAMKLSFNVDRGVYEWTQTGPLIGEDFIEPCVARYRDTWIVTARMWSSHDSGGGPVAWMRTEDPFGVPPAVVRPPAPTTTAPVTMFACADGVIRLLTGDPTVSPYHHQRNPLYCWDVDPDHHFVVTNRCVIFDSYAAGVPIRRESGIAVDQAKVLPHAGGDSQLLLHRVRPVATNDPRKMKGVVVNEQDKSPAGMYTAAIRYDQAYPGLWKFASEGS